MNPRLFLPALLAASFASAQPAAPDAAPTKADHPPAAADGKTEMQKWIETTDAQWQAAFKRDVTDMHEAELKKVMLQFLTSLDDAIKKASAASDLKAAVALRDEQKRFGDTQMFPDEDDKADAPAVKAARATIRAQLAKVDKDSEVRAKALHAKYDQVLAKAQAQLTQAQRLDDALELKNKRDEVAAAWLPSPESNAKPEPPPGEKPTARGSGSKSRVLRGEDLVSKTVGDRVRVEGTILKTFAPSMNEPNRYYVQLRPDVLCEFDVKHGGRELRFMLSGIYRVEGSRTMVQILKSGEKLTVEGTYDGKGTAGSAKGPVIRNCRSLRE